MTVIRYETEESVNETLDLFKHSIKDLNKILRSEETSVEIDGVQKSTLKYILSSLGLFSPVMFESNINVDNYKFTVIYQNQLYIPKREVPFLTTGNFDPDDWYLLHTDYILQERNEINFNRMKALGNDIVFIINGLLYITDNSLDMTTSVASDLSVAGIGIPKYTKRKLGHYGIELPEIVSTDYQMDQQALTSVEEENYRVNLNNFNRFINDHPVDEIINLNDEHGKLNIFDTLIIENRNIVFNKKDFLINSYASNKPIIEIFSDNTTTSSIENLTINGNSISSHGIKITGGSVKLNNIDVLYPKLDVIHISQDDDKQHFEKIDISYLESRYGNTGNGINIVFPEYTENTPSRTSIEYLNLSNIYIFNSGISDISISFNDDSLDTNLSRYINNFNIRDSFFRYSYSFINTDDFTLLDFSNRLNSSIVISRNSNSKGYIQNLNIFNYKADLENNRNSEVLTSRHRNGLEITDLLTEVNDLFNKNVIYNFVSHNTNLGIYYTWWDHTTPSAHPLSKETITFNQETDYQITYKDTKFIYTNRSSGIKGSNYKDNELHDMLYLASNGNTFSRIVNENGISISHTVEDNKVLFKAISNRFREVYKVVMCTQPDDNALPIFLEATIISGFIDDDLEYRAPIIEYILHPETSTIVSDYMVSLVTYPLLTNGLIHVVNNTNRNLELVYNIKKII